MNSTRNPGRVAGIWYLLLTLIGPLRLMYIPNRLFVAGTRPQQSTTLQLTNGSSVRHAGRFSVQCDPDISGAAFYKLFKGWTKNLAVQVVIFGGVMPAVINFVSVVNDAAA